MTDYYLGLGYGQTYTDGTFGRKPSLPLTEDDTMEVGIVMSDDKIDYEDVIKQHRGKLEKGDTLTVTYPNQASLWILDEFAEDFHVPHNQKEELYNFEGLQDTFIWFVDAEEENWYWLTDAQVDYYNDEGRPVPIFPADEE